MRNDVSVTIMYSVNASCPNSIVCDYPVVLNIDAACAPVPR